MRVLSMAWSRCVFTALCYELTAAVRVTQLPSFIFAIIVDISRVRTPSRLLPFFTNYCAPPNWASRFFSVFIRIVGHYIACVGLATAAVVIAHKSSNRQTHPALWFFASHPATRSIVLVVIFNFIVVLLY